MSISDSLTGKEVYKILLGSLSEDWREFVVLVADKLGGNPFSVLVAIILSQNTNDKNSIRAYESLKEAINVITPESILKLSEDDLARIIRPAGLHKQKARAIRALASRLLEVEGEEYLLNVDADQLRKFLTSLPGIGSKTADVFLSFYRGVEVFAVDTHARRIAIRWGIARPGASYDEVSSALKRFFSGVSLEKAHRLLIVFGRTYCRARRPRCPECPLRKACPSARRL